jgi:peptidyl-dipeptidase A
MTASVAAIITRPGGRILVKKAALLAASTALLVAPDAWAQTAAEAEAFANRAEQELYEPYVRNNRAAWVASTYITGDTEIIAAEADTVSSELGVRLALEAARFAGAPALSAETARKLDFLRQGLTLPAPTRPGAAKELSEISVGLTSTYGTGTATLKGKPIEVDDLYEAMEKNRNPEELTEMWTSWHDNVGRPMKKDYVRLVEIANEGARELGYADVGALWRAGYDMPAEDFSALVDKLWGEVKPLYDDLHCYMRAELNETYGDAVQPATGPIRGDLLGDPWAQQWSGLYDIAAPAGAGDIGFNTSELLTGQGYDVLKMMRTGEAFFTSLGFQPLPDTFWERSMFTKPADREVVCHASAWSIDELDDLRLKMCTRVNENDFKTVHHELGHIFYYRAYSGQPFLFRTGAHDGFHEAAGDMLALSMTPEYLVQIGLLDHSKVPSADKDIGLLLKESMDRVAFLPFGLLVDKWRWGVFDGSIKPDDYQTAWDGLKLEYQGVTPPVARDAGAFDPGAKYHVASTTPYIRYFLSYVLMFQFYEAACEQAGWTGPLHRCSFYGNKEVGKKFEAMLAMGASKPWPDALEAFTGTREMSGKSLVNYFAPLHAWLKEENKGRACGW